MKSYKCIAIIITMYEWLESNKDRHPELVRKYSVYEQNSQKKDFKRNQSQDIFTSMYNNRGMIFSDQIVNNLHKIGNV